MQPAEHGRKLLPADLVERWGERAAIMEYAGGLSREDAEWQAFSGHAIAGIGGWRGRHGVIGINIPGPGPLRVLVRVESGSKEHKVAIQLAEVCKSVQCHELIIPQAVVGKSCSGEGQFPS